MHLGQLCPLTPNRCAVKNSCLPICCENTEAKKLSSQMPSEYRILQYCDRNCDYQCFLSLGFNIKFCLILNFALDVHRFLKANTFSLAMELSEKTKSCILSLVCLKWASLTPYQNGLIRDNHCIKDSNLTIMPLLYIYLVSTLCH